MEKITKKKKTKKGLKKRIGLFAIGGLSLVLTICLSVGATLAWFAGSTHADKSLFMGGPVYVEMTGRDGSSANWQGGSGNLDITSFERGMGTVGEENGVLLPGQRFALYSQARVFSTTTTDSTTTSNVTNTSSGANVTNTSNTAGGEHRTSIGRKTTTTSSVLRARFSVNVEFDPTVGFNNFTGTDYAENYPVQSGQYMGNNTNATGEDVDIKGTVEHPYTGLAWSDALGKPAYVYDYEEDTYPANARRDGVINTSDDNAESGDKGTYVEFTADTSTQATLQEIKDGTKRSIYSWKFVSKEVYNAAYTAKPTTQPAYDPVTEAKTTGLATTFKYVQMGAPFDGNTKIGDTESTYYGVWILTNNGTNMVMKESDSFYKTRCNNYIQTYVEQYPTEYGDFTERKIGDGLKALETALNQSFVNLVNDSSNAIIAGYLKGMTVNPATGIMSYNPGLITEATATPENPAQWPTEAGKYASWLYVDPTIGNDTNTNELSTSTGGWWYLVECDKGTVGNYTIGGQAPESTDVNKINAVKDVLGTPSVDSAGNNVRSNTITPDGTFTRADRTATDTTRLNAKLYEIKPNTAVGDVLYNNNGNVQKMVSYQFPFVNGSAVLAGDELTNIFANAKITVQISFQAVQAFFPFTTSIDGLTYKDTLLGTKKALNIANAIPIYNEAFDYYENTTSSAITGL